MATNLIATQITDQQLATYADFIYERTGIRLSPRKKSLISNRLRRRLRANKLDCYDDYLQLIKTKRKGDPEWNEFLEAITTHETYLFRDQNQWDWFCDEYIPTIEKQAEAGDRRHELRIWSAACSTGDEAYTMACCLAAKLKSKEKWKIEILGTDIGTGTLGQAREALFGERSMQRVPDNWKKRFFEEKDGGLWSPKSELRCWTNFRYHNLIEPLLAHTFDLVCLKNVLIYFDAESKKLVMDHLYNQLKVGGHLMIGPAEGVSGLVGQYKRVSTWLFEKTKSGNGFGKGT